MSHLSETHMHYEEQDPPHHNTDPILQHKDDTNDRAETNPETKNGTLWKMEFDGSCTRRSAGAGVWIYDTESDYTESLLST